MYAELVARSNCSFLKGASHPEELVAAAAAAGLFAFALTDDDGLYGVVKAHLEAKQRGVKLLVASRLTLEGGPQVCLYAKDLEGYGNLCELISESRLAHPKGSAGISWRRVAERSGGLFALLPYPDAPQRVAPLAEAFPGRFYVGLQRSHAGGDEARLQQALALAQALELPCCAHNDVHTHARARQPLQDVMTAIREGTTVERAGKGLFPNAERTLKTPEEMLALFADLPEAVGRSVELASACSFQMDELRYTFSREELPAGVSSPQQYLEELTWKGIAWRYGGEVPDDVTRQLHKELDLIGALDFAGYFLALWDIVRFAREQGILCQGRGSAANSAVCFALQITSIDPVRMGLLFERFLSMERREPPDIDVDFEHQRREEVLQYVYRKHGRHRSAMVCELICFRDKLAVREVGKALGLSLDQVDRLSKTLSGYASEPITDWHLAEAGLSPEDRRVQQTLTLAAQLEGVPRHLSIHVGGFVITHDRLTSLAPVENAAMKDRTVVQWEKDDLSALNILKVDLLALGMLTVIARCFELVREVEGVQLTMANVPSEDPAVYQMLCEADAIGVFQIESRAQMNMLPRLKPRCFYDLVVEIAIIRPGPIVGDMVHPYLRRRDGREPVVYPSKDVEHILERTLGVPLFQEQAMRLAMVAAGFSPGEADALRRALSNKRALQLLPSFKDRFTEGALQRGYTREFTESLFNQFKGFAHYGFPESHSASFALIAYVSSWLKRYHPSAFCAALLDAQPMGFYAPHTLVDDARRHGVEVRAIDVNASGWRCRLEPVPGAVPAVVPAVDLAAVGAPGAIQVERSADREVALGDLAEAAPRGAPTGSAETAERELAAEATGSGEAADRELAAEAARRGALTGSADREAAPQARAGAERKGAPTGSGEAAERELAPGGREAAPSEGTQAPKGERAPSGSAGAPAREARDPRFSSQPALRLGLELVKGLREDTAKAIEAERAKGPFRSIGELARRTRIPRHELTRLGLAGALESLVPIGHEATRRTALWEIAALGPLETDDLFFGLPMDETAVPLPPMGLRERVSSDFAAVGLSLEKHPLALLRAQLTARQAITAAQLQGSRDGTRARMGGLVIVRQRPPTAKGFTFMSVEDETGIANFVLEPRLFDRFRREITGTALVLGEGVIEREGRVVNLKVDRIEGL